MKEKKKPNPGDMILSADQQLDERIKSEGHTDAALFGHYEMTRTGKHNEAVYRGQKDPQGQTDSQMYDRLMDLDEKPKNRGTQ